jgi:prolyl-tRNA editing enzyme YbaK/EbsC (Cys-tRNA(Pro) deacylase)
MSELLPIVEAYLEKSGLRYTVFSCDPELADTASFCRTYGYSEDQSANTIIVAARTEPIRYVACVVLASTKLDVNKTVCKLLGVRKASFAPMEQALELSGMEYGGVTIFGLPSDIPVYVDRMVMEQKQVVMGGGNRSSKVILDPHELEKMPSVSVIQDLAKPKAT